MTARALSILTLERLMSLPLILPPIPRLVPRLSRRFLTLACLLAAGSCHAGATLPGPAYPEFRSAEQIETSCEQGLAGARERVKALEDSRVDASWLARLDDLSAYFEDAQGPVDFAQYVLPDKALRDAAQACALKWAEFTAGIAQSEKLYRSLRKAQPKDAIDKELVRLSLAQFEDAGVTLPASTGRLGLGNHGRISDPAPRSQTGTPGAQDTEGTGPGSGTRRRDRAAGEALA